MATFRFNANIDPQSPTRAPSTVVFQDGKGVWAEFVNGTFETDDKAIIARLTKTEGVEKVAESNDKPNVDSTAQ